MVKRLRSGPLRRPWRVVYHGDAAGPAERLLASLAPAAPRLALVR